MNDIWIARTTGKEKTIYLPHTAGITRSEVVSKIWFKALDEGFHGTIDERLAELGWEIVHVQLTEIQDGDR